MSSLQEKFEAKLKRNTYIGVNPDEINFYEGISRSRALAKADIVAGVCLILEAVIFYRGRIAWYVFQALVAFLGYNLIYLGRYRMRTAFRDYIYHRIVPYARSLRSRNSYMEILVPARRVFRKYQDLKELESNFCEQLLWRFHEFEYVRQVDKWKRRNNKLQKELLEIVRTSPLPADERVKLEAEVLEVWETLPLNPERRKRFVAKIDVAILSSISRHKFNVETKPTLNTESLLGEQQAGDWRLKILETEARECQSETARVLYLQALKETDRRTRIRLLGMAIREERQVEEFLSEEKEPAKTIPVAATNEVKFIALDQLLEDKFQIAHLVPESLNAAMIKEILLELLDPGNMQRRFQKAYRPESRLKRRVRQRYESWTEEQFDPRSFYESLKWLVDEGIVFMKPKKEDVYSLQANNLHARSEQARAIIAAVIRLDREIRNS